MRLKKLEIIGFKSFRDKVSLDFSERINAIVGPNGCGKSNIVDAIRWVMGEQRVTMLRGKRMEDVIFNGTSDAPPVGMSEIAMTLSSNGNPFPDPYGSCEEVTVSRRIFRDSEGEYAINGVGCRLLDVKEFFLDTGAGPRTYSVVEQNSVSSLIEAKPEERRQFIEEAAGIAKYKSRKESAVRKMEATRQNMLRLGDIIREVKTQLNAVSRQAKRADQYKALRQRLKEAEIALALQSYGELSDRNAALAKIRNERRDGEFAIRTRLQTAEAALDALKAETLESETLLSGCQDRLYDIKNRIGIKEQAVEFAKGKIADLSARQEKDVEKMASFEARKGALADEAEVLRQADSRTNERIAALEAEIDAIRRDAEELKTNDGSLYRELEELKVRYIDVVTEKAALKNRLADLAKRSEDVRRREEAGLREIEECTDRLAALDGTLGELKSGLAADEAALEDLRRREESLEQETILVKGDLHTAEGDIASLREEIGRQSARLVSLKEFQEGYTWCSEGTRSILTAPKDKRAGFSRETFYGLVADHIEVPSKYETAVEAVLGEKLQYVVVRSQEDAVAAIDYLKSHALGRGSFVPIRLRNTGGNGSDRPGEALRLIDQVNVREDFRDIADYLLGDVMLIPSLREGISLWRRNGFVGTFVTPEGDIISPQGVLTGGRGAEGERSLLRNRREISELGKEVGRLEQRLMSRLTDREKDRKLIAQREEELLAVRSQLQKLMIQVKGHTKDLERYDDEQKRTGRHLQVLQFNLESLRTEAASATEKTGEIGGNLSSLEEKESRLNASMAQLQEQWREVRGHSEARERQLTEKKILLASLEEKRSGNEKDLARLREESKQTAIEIDRRIGEMEICRGEMEKLTVQIADDHVLLQGLYRDYESLESELSKLREALKEKEARTDRQAAEIQGIKKSLEALAGEIGSGELDIREVGFQMESLRKGIREKHYIDIDPLLAGFQRLGQEDIQGLSLQLARDRQNLDGFGEVNLLALGEYEQLKERYEFLSAQEADLNTSLNALQQTIVRINRITRRRFAETFEAVNVCFQEVFARIFRGGKGELRLTDESNLLETGVDIDIQIPGKRTQNISLLSGGEKSLAALALIFAILLHRPSPFLVLDEVDAALDDANISLFNELLGDLAATSQILLVTHNKKTMEVAQSLFGVTMQKQGISSLVSVNLL
ncbi:MAG: chromosome segregation protein SMC [Deltaproteobacteria bacterium]|nr:chromosome segregation protein SMC [Deltaproteobacteria bacterium]